MTLGLGRIVVLLFVLMISGAQAWCSQLINLGTYLAYEKPPSGIIHFQVFEIFDLRGIPYTIEKLFRDESEFSVEEASNPKRGFMKIEGLDFPNKVYLATAHDLIRGQIPGAEQIGSNARPYVVSDFAEHNRAVIRMMETIPSGTKIWMSAAMLVRLQLSDGSFVLLPNKGTWNQGRHQYPRGTIQPSAIGGVAEIDANQFLTLSGKSLDFAEKSGLQFERKIVNGRTDLNIRLQAPYWREVAQWFHTTPHRERDPSRELYEELVEENAILSYGAWKALGLRSTCDLWTQKEKGGLPEID